jgi:hypothetical protein
MSKKATKGVVLYKDGLPTELCEVVRQNGRHIVIKRATGTLISELSESYVFSRNSGKPVGDTSTMWSVSLNELTEAEFQVYRLAKLKRALIDRVAASEDPKLLTRLLGSFREKS